jgi:hypothetical protein
MIGGVNVRVTGVNKLKATFIKLGLNFDKELARALYQEGEHIMGQSKAFFVPVDHGPLRDSGHVQLPEMDAKGPVVVLGFGGPATAYAVVQHESLHFKHTVGQAKYLEKPALARAAIMDKVLAERLRRRLKSIVAA